jgi:hypothetical protein
VTAAVPAMPSFDSARQLETILALVISQGSHAKHKYYHCPSHFSAALIIIFIKIVLQKNKFY